MEKICKIVYFDEESVTDYVQIVAGGELENTTELLKTRKCMNRWDEGSWNTIPLDTVLNGTLFESSQVKLNSAIIGGIAISMARATPA